MLNSYKNVINERHAREKNNRVFRMQIPIALLLLSSSVLGIFFANKNGWALLERYFAVEEEEEEKKIYLTNVDDAATAKLLRLLSFGLLINNAIPCKKRSHLKSVVGGQENTRKKKKEKQQTFDKTEFSSLRK